MTSGPFDDKSGQDGGSPDPRRPDAVEEDPTNSASFLDIARIEAEGYTDEQFASRLGDWTPERLDALAERIAAQPVQPAVPRWLYPLLGGLAAALAVVALLAVRGTTELQARLGAAEASIGQLVVTEAGAARRVVTGRSCATDTPWKSCDSGCGNRKPTSAILDVDTSAAGFADTPQYFVSVTGSSSWVLEGLSAIYNPSPDGFRLYAYRQGSSALDIVRRDGFCVNWVGIGQ